ncbi:MAG: hypothetical protein PHT95_07820, partial [Candidatus Omnitrophica bacterium]|nr:hypothetical protein [Candidatus Omnitrophota bacterium]
GLYEAGSRLAGSTILVKKEAGVYVFMTDGELDDAALTELLEQAGFADPENAEAMKQMILAEFAKRAYYYGDPRTGSVDIGGITYDISEVGDEVRLTARNVFAGGEPAEVRRLMCVKDSGEWMFYGDTSSDGAVRQDADGTVIFGNYERFDIVEVPEDGTLKLSHVKRHSASAGQAPLIEVNGEVYSVTDNGDGSYTFFDGTHSYVSDGSTMTVRLGEMLFTTEDAYNAGMTEEELSMVRGVLYDITIADDGTLGLVKHADRRRGVQMIELDSRAYAVTTDYLGYKTLAAYPSGVVELTIAPDQNEVFYEARTYLVTRDSLGNITLTSGEGEDIVASVTLNLVKVNGVTYTVKSTGNVNAPYAFVYQGETEYSRIEEGANKVDLGFGQYRITYNIEFDQSGAMRLIEDYLQGTGSEGRFITVSGKQDFYDVSVDDQSITLTDGVNVVTVQKADLKGKVVQLVVDDQGTIRDYNFIFDPVTNAVVLSAVTSTGSNDFLTSAAKQVVNLGEVWYRIILESGGTYSFTWTDNEGTAHTRYASLSDGQVRLDGDVYFTLARDDDTGMLVLAQRDYVTSLDVTLYPTSDGLPTKVVNISGVDYVLEYSVGLEWSDKIRDPANDKDNYDEDGNFTGRTYAYKEGYMTVPEYTLTRASDGVVYRNRLVTKGIQYGGSEFDDPYEWSREEQRYIIDLPEMSIGLEGYPNVYTPALVLTDNQTGAEKIFYSSERYWVDGVNSYYLYSDGELYQTRAYSSMTASEEMLIGDLIVTVNIGGEDVDLVMPGVLDPKEGAYDVEEKTFTGYLDESRISLTALNDPSEEFTDTNSNGVWDSGEPLADTNGNGVWDASPKYGGRYSLAFINKVPVNVTTGRVVTLMEAQNDWQNNEIVYANGAYPVRQEVDIDGVKYYAYPEDGTVKIDAVHFESQPKEGERRALILGVKDYSDEINVNSGYG